MNLSPAGFLELDKCTRRTIGLLLWLAGGAFTAHAQPFTHPGIWHKASDLDRMKYMVQAGREPWKTSFALLQADPKASYTYTVRGLNFTTLSRAGDHSREFEDDSRAAYLNALMWYITSDTRHAAKAIAILNTWSSVTSFSRADTAPLDAGIYTSELVNAAEIIKNTNAGWTVADVARFKAMLVYPGYSTTAAPSATAAVTFYWNCYQGDPGRHGNQDLYAMKAVMQMGVFLDNRVMYDRALRYLKAQPHRSGDLPYASGPGITGVRVAKNSYNISHNFTNGNAIRDYIYNAAITNYIWDNGQCQESSRDQSHTLLGVGAQAEVAEIAWNQGDDLYGIGRRRILRGLEYNLRYNVSARTAYPDQPAPWEPVSPNDFYQRFDRTGRWKSLRINPYNDQDTVTVLRGRFDTQPCWELPLAHYQQRLGVVADSVRWTQRGRDGALVSMGYEQSGSQLDHPGWGALTNRRPELSPGDPCTFVNGQPFYAMNVLPGVVEAENFDYFVTGGRGKTFNDLTAINTGGQYRTSEAVDVETCSEGGFNLTDLQAGEWLNYTVAVPTAGTYRLAVRYAAASAGGALRVEVDGVNQTGTVAVPFGSGGSAGPQDWQDLTVAASAPLAAGVQSFRIFVLGVDRAFNLNKFTVVAVPATVPPLAPASLTARAGYGQVLLTWPAAIGATSYRLKRAAASGGPYATLASGITTPAYADLGLSNGTTYYYVVTAVNAIGEGSASNEASATPLATNSIVEDHFTTNEGPVTGRLPEDATVGLRTYRVANTAATSGNSVVGGAAHLLSNLGETVDIRSTAGYVKPAVLTISTIFTVGTVENNTPIRLGRGIYLGFWSSLPGSGDSFTNMRGIIVNPESGALQLWNGNGSSTAAPVQSQPYQGTWVDGVRSHLLSYTINTATGNLSNCVFDGVVYPWGLTTIFTAGNTSYAGFGSSPASSDQACSFDWFRLYPGAVTVTTANQVGQPTAAIPSLQLYPNPFPAQGFRLRVANMPTGGGTVRLYDARGQLVFAQEVGAGLAEVAITPAQPLTSGLYLVVWQAAGTGPKLTGKVLVE